MARMWQVDFGEWRCMSVCIAGNVQPRNCGGVRVYRDSSTSVESDHPYPHDATCYWCAAAAPIVPKPNITLRGISKNRG